jgi:hypothetical protein
VCSIETLMPCSGSESACCTQGVAKSSEIGPAVIRQTSTAPAIARPASSAAV